MKKNILALVLALSAAMSTTAFAATVNLESPEDTKAILMCYNENGSLVYSNIYKSENGVFNMDVPSQYDEMKKKVYFIDTKKFSEVTEVTDNSPTPAPSETEEPSTTVKPTASPKPTQTPSSSNKKFPSIYEKEVDAIYAPALVKDVESRVNSKDEDVYALTVFYHGEEVVIGVDEGLKISTAPEEYAYMQGQTADSLEAGDVVYMSANIAGDRIKTIDFIFRPTQEDIATGDTDYGTNFEKLFVSGGKVAGKWTFMKYGEKVSSDRYQYAFGIIGKKEGNVLTLINKTGSEDDGIEVAFTQDTIVYTCDVDAKEYELEIGSAADIRTTIPKNKFNNDEGAAELNSDYSYNYALVRVVDGTATEMVLYNNYNN